MRGMRLVSRKFRSSCKNRRARGAGFIGLSIGTVRQGGFHGGDTIHMDDSLPFSSVPALWALAIGALAWTLPRARRRLQLSRAKHRSLAGHARIARRVAALIPGYAYDEASFFASDGAPDAVQAQRRAGLDRLAAVFEQRWPISAATTAAARELLPDLHFTSRYRVPFQYSPYLRQRLKLGGFVAQRRRRGRGPGRQPLHRPRRLLWRQPVRPDFYKDCIAEAVTQVQALGPVLGSPHPCVLDNVRRLARLSGLDEVSFHMSGTEAVMQAVRLARYHTGAATWCASAAPTTAGGRTCSPAPGNPLPPRDTYTLRDMDERSLQVLRTRRDIACVLVNPLQACTPTATRRATPRWSTAAARAGVDREAYTRWLQQLREVCSERGIVLIFDEVFVGFRLAAGGAQEYFGVRADMVTYGKTLGGGLPVGVVCGRRELMQRWREQRPADICFARGTFNSHPYVMAAMKAFLERLERPR
jgi:glutamate-1-semialdehyde 2,1-aminomutase